MTGDWNTCLILATVHLSKNLYGRTEHFAESFDVAAMVNPACGPVCVGHDIDGLKVKRMRKNSGFAFTPAG